MNSLHWLSIGTIFLRSFCIARSFSNIFLVFAFKIKSIGCLISFCQLIFLGNFSCCLKVFSKIEVIRDAWGQWRCWVLHFKSFPEFFRLCFLTSLLTFLRFSKSNWWGDVEHARAGNWAKKSGSVAWIFFPPILKLVEKLVLKQIFNFES